MDKSVLMRDARFPSDLFSTDAADIIRKLLEKRPEKRLGAGPRGADLIKEHKWFANIDWGLLEAGYVKAPFVPSVRARVLPACAARGAGR
jgi:p70 ribosomal S6 kinase